MEEDLVGIYNHVMLSILSPHPCPMLPVPIALHAGSLHGSAAR